MNVDEIVVGGAPVAKFPTIGTKHGGKILAWDDVQATDMDTNEPAVYKDSGKPVMQYVITVQTDERDPEIEDDDGKRRIFAKGQMRQACRDAIRTSGQKSGSVVGGELWVMYAEDKPSEKRGFNPQKIYKAKYEAPPQGPLASEEDGW